MYGSAWIVTRVNGRISSISADYRHLASIALHIASMAPEETSSVETSWITTDELLSMDVTWDDLNLFGSAFQIKVWKTLFDISVSPRLYSYSELASMCGIPAGVRAVAHAVAVNPVAYIIPCHLIVPKETIDRVRCIHYDAKDTLFKGTDLYLLDTIDVGQYAYGSDCKRSFIKHDLV